MSQKTEICMHSHQYENIKPHEYSYHHNTLTAISAKYTKNTSKVISNITLQILTHSLPAI